MVKILAGLLAAIMIAVAGFFGFEFYVQRQVAGETDVVKTVQEVYQAGLDNLSKLYGFKR